MKKETYYTFYALNYFLFIVGALIVWMASHSWIAILGTVVASLHFAIPEKNIYKLERDAQKKKEKFCEKCGVRPKEIGDLCRQCEDMYRLMEHHGGKN